MNDKRMLVLHIALPEIYADDLDERISLWMMDDDTKPTARDLADMITEELMRDRVGVTLVTLPGEKCLNSEFDVVSYTGTIVGAETIER